MKVLRIIADLYPAVYGGAPIHAHEMSKLQSTLNCEVEVLTCDYDITSKYIAKDGYKIISHRSWIRPYGNPIAPTIFSSLLKMRKKFDIFHAHDTLFFTTNLAALAKKFDTPPLVITNHGLISQTAPLWLSDLYYSSIGKWTLNAADKIICYNDIEKEKVIKIGIAPEKIKIIPNGVDTTVFKPIKKEKKYFQILWVGRYKPGKDIETLIEAAKIILNKHDNVKFLLVGNGPLQNNIKMYASKLDKSEKIRFIDHISNDKMPDIYNESDVFVLPSIDEGVPRTMLEAMACGLPVVGTKLPQLTYLITGCGLLVPKRDPQALAEGILKIISDESLALKLGENGRKKVVKKNSWIDTVKKTVKLYEELNCQK